jgi:AraC-like DNA-binding protein
MIGETTPWWSDAADRRGQQHATPRAAVRFWRPAPDQSQEFSCAYVDGGSAALHVHEEWQFAVAAEPSSITLGAFRRYSAYTTDVTVVHPYDVHTEGGVSGEPRAWLVLYVARGLVESAYQDGSGYVPRFDSPIVRDPDSSHTLTDLLQRSMEGSLAGSDFTDRVSEWLLHFVRNHATGTATQSAAGRIPGPVERARTYLQAHSTEPLSLSDLVDATGVTASHLVRLFSRTIGLPPKSYHAQLRLARARRLLADGRPATWVAYECGFADQSHLSRRFKEFYGLTPGAFQAYYRRVQISTFVESSGQTRGALGSNAA